DAVVTKAMRKDPIARYQTADEMRADLHSVLRGEEVGMPVPVPLPANGSNSTRVMTATVPPATLPPDEVYRELEDEPRSQMPFILTAAGLLVALGILLFFLFQLAGGADEGDLIEVPNVTGLSQDQALARLQGDGFLVRPLFEPSDTMEVGFVIRTDPPFGTEVEEGSSIDVYISSGAEEVPVPPLVGKTVDEARVILEDAGLTLGNVEERPDPDRPEGIIIEQSPAAGVEVGNEAPVNVVVSSGPEMVILPDLTETTERDAVAQLNTLGLLFTVDEEYSSDVEEGLVIRTDPVADTEMQTGGTVLLVISLGPAPVEVPNLNGLTPGQAEDILDDLGLVLEVSNSTQPVADPDQNGLVVSQNPGVGATVFPGDIVTVTLGEFEPPPTTTTTAPTTTTTDPTTTTAAP
ncbi:MAG: PASTA domain-containing protein, partial [Acidimicrobiia bacterium]